MPVSKNKIREKRLADSIDKEVFQNEDFNRHVQETARILDLPEDAVGTVIKDFITQIRKLIYVRTRVKKRITVFGFFNIEIKNTKKKSKF